MMERTKMRVGLALRYYGHFPGRVYEEVIPRPLLPPRRADGKDDEVII